MSPRYVLRAAVFGFVTALVVYGFDRLGADVLKWGWLQDPGHGWLPHEQFHRAVFALSAAGALAGMYVNRAEPLSWLVILVAALLFGIGNVVAAPLAYLWEDVWGLGIWLFLGSTYTLVLADGQVRRGTPNALRG